MDSQSQTNLTLPDATLQTTVTVTPLELIELPVVLDGRNGSNRANPDRAQITAKTDVEAVRAWLSGFMDTMTTLATYRKEAERLLLWCAVELRKPLSSMRHEDWLLYKNFLANPCPTWRWVSEDGRKLPRSHPDWKPFAGPLSTSSQRQAGTILNAMFSWLVNAGYLAANPLALSRERRRNKPARVTRYLDDDVWAEVKLTIEMLPNATTRERQHHARLRWIFSLLYICGLRISEVSGTRMGAFFSRRAADGTDRWWLEVVGKGAKPRIIPATSELMAELGRYRDEMGLVRVPKPMESTPLVLPIGGKHRVLSRGGLHTIVKSVFELTAERYRLRGPGFEAQANLIMQASAHWLRHTAGSHMSNNALDIRHVRDNLGHESIATTNIYLHSPDDVRHAETEARHRIDWGTEPHLNE